MKNVLSPFIFAICCASAVGAAANASAGDTGAAMTGGVGFSSHNGLKYDNHGNVLKLDHLTTFDQQIGITKPLTQQGNWSLDVDGILSHESGRTGNFAINGTPQTGDVKFDRLDAFGDVTASYRVSQIVPYVGLGLGAVADKVSLPQAPEYKDNYLAGRAFVGASWESKSGFGVNVRATSRKRFE